MIIRARLAENRTRFFITRFLSPMLMTVVTLALLSLAGCRVASNDAMPPESAQVPATFVPGELSKTVLPQYVIEPPDILQIEAIRLMPRNPYRLKAGDALAVQVIGTPNEFPISGPRPIEPGGAIRLGPRYGSVNVANLTVEEAQGVISQHLQGLLKEPIVTVSLAEIAAQQQIKGQHLVGPDGVVTLGAYGGVRVVGMTIPQAKAAIEAHLTQYLDQPEISVDVFAYNSKVFYIVTQGAGLGDAVYRFPITGNETVLDAISQINGLNQLTSKRIWIARPTNEPGKCQVLPVEWDCITAQANASNNFQLLPGDRVFVAENKMVAFDNGLAKFLAPFERIMGFSVFGAGTATRFSGNVLGGGGNPRANF